MSRLHTPSRGNRSSTARASLGAKTVKALPLPCFCSPWARYCWPAGWLRRHHIAASEKAHCRDALPIFVPEGPER
jgi:hypothetical protein